MKATGYHLSMLLPTYLKLSRGNASDLARGMRVSRVMVYIWATGKKPVPQRRCVQIEKLTKGAVTRQELRPDDFGEYWPELLTAAAPSAPGHNTEDQGTQQQETRDAE